MDKLAILTILWALIFAMLLVPARKAGMWVARPLDGLAGTTLSILRCFVLAWGAVAFVWLALRIGGREIVFPHVKADYFGLSYVATLLFVPAFVALVAGYLHARTVAGRRTLSSFLSAGFKDDLAKLFALAVSIAFLGFGGWSLLRWYETGQRAVRPMSLIVPFMVVLVMGLGFMIERSSMTKSIKAVTHVAVLIVALAVSFYWVRTSS